MIPISELAELVDATAHREFPEALKALTEGAMKLTKSRNAMIGIVDHEEGIIEIRFAVGSDIGPEILGQKLRLTEGSGQGIVAAAAAIGAPMIISDVTADLRYHKLLTSSLSEIAIPIRDREGRVVAVLNVESDEKSHYSDSERQLCECIGALISNTIERESVQRQQRALIEIGSVIEKSESEEELIHQVVNVVDDLLSFHTCSIFIYDSAREKYMLRASSGELKAQINEVGYAAGEGLTGWVCASKQPLLIHEPQSDPRWLGRHLGFPAGTISSYLAVPVVFRDRSFGAIRVIRRHADNPYLFDRYTQSDLVLLSAIADQLGSGLENDRKMNLAIQVERMAAWGEMSAKSSHMIGNRVFAIKGDVNELGHLVTEPELDREELAKIQKSLDSNVHRIEEILQDFRDYLTAAQVKPIKCDLNQIVSDTVKEVFPKRASVVLKLELAPSLPEVLVDPRRFSRAVSEMVENSLHHSTEGELRVETSIADEAMARMMALDPSQKYIAVTFADHGQGVPLEFKEKIFEPFYSSRVKGMGLGLSIVKGIVRAHGGAVKEIGTFGEGAIFVFLVPIPERH